MNKELDEVKNLVHALEERVEQSKFDPTDINAMLGEIHRIEKRLSDIKQSALNAETKKAA